jgi:hypothetical protein
MADIKIGSESKTVRPQFYGSKESKFYLSMSNRLLIPALAFAVLSITQTRVPLLFFCAILLVEIVLVYFVKMTASEVVGATKRYLFSSARKRVKN